MQLLTLDTGKAQRLFWSVAAAAVVVGAFTIRQTDPVLVAAAVLVMIIGLAPFYLWLLGSREGLPIWPAFSIYACTLAAMPALQKAQALERFPDSAILESLLTMAGFFALGTIFWLSLTASKTIPPRKCLMFESGSVVRSLLLCIVTGVLFQANSLLGWVHFPGNTMQIARGISGGLSFLGIFGMAYFHGRGLLDRFQIAAYLSLTAVILIFALTGLLIANIIQPIALALIGYTLGASRPPWVILGALFVLVAILHAGKYTMRDIYFAGAESAPRIELASLPSFYSEWFSYGFSELGGLGGIVEVETKDDSPTTVFERSGNLHMLVLVQHKSPEEVPFLDGLTYAPIPQMLIPRFLMPDKAISHAGNILLSVNYGLVDTDGARNVSIGWPLIAEAYANFGYIGVFTLSILLSCGYAYATRLSSRVPITSFRFVAALVIMAGVTNENTLGVFIGSQFQAVVGVALASFFLMRRQPNPYAEETENQETRAYNAEGQQLVGNGRAETGDQSLARPIQLAADGGVVRTMPVKTPQRLARWMPRRIRAAVLAQQAAAADGTEEEGERLKDEETKRPETPKRPRQLAVPYQLYRRYRG